MTHSERPKTYLKICRLLLLASLLLSGCAPEEKTMLLPMAQTSEEESESADPAKDFTVK